MSLPRPAAAASVATAAVLASLAVATWPAAAAAAVAAADPLPPPPPAAAAAAPPAIPPSAPVGAAPEAPTAEQVALRDQAVLLKRRQVTLELAAAYGRAGLDYGVAQAELQQASAEAAVRYGLWDDLQLSARLGWRGQRTRTFALDAPDGLEERGTVGDLGLGLFGVLVREGTAWPNVILSVDGVVPSGPGDAGLGAGLAFTRSHDPVILFAGVSYLYGLDTDPTDPDRSLAAHNVGFNVGYAFAVNESVALNGQLIGSWRSYPSGTSPHLSRERYRLQLGATWLLTRTLFVEPTVAVAVGAAQPDLTIGLSMPWSF